MGKITAPRRAIVIGAGIGGLAAAIGLQCAGFEVEVFERAAEIREIGAGLSLWPNAVVALARLGVADAVRVRALPELEGAIRTASGAVLFATSANDLRRTFGEVPVMVHRAELQTILLDALGPERVRLAMDCVGLEQDGANVTAHFERGAAATAGLLVGADGIGSSVRAQLHGDAPPVYAGYTAWRAVTGFAHTHLVPGETWGRGARFGQVPMSGERVYWFAAKDAAEGDRSPDGEKAELRRVFGGWHAPIEELIAATDEQAILRNDIYDRPALRWWGRGLVTLLGDAAHPMTPNLGQGACQAIEDAVVLMDCLRGTADIPGALQAYEALRIARTTFLVERSRQVGAVAQWSHPLAAGARNVLARVLLGRLQHRELRRVVGAGIEQVQISGPGYKKGLA